MNQHEMTAVPKGIRADFVMIASGNGMVGYGIQHGDDVYIRQQDTANNGDIVAIIAGGEAIVRRYYRSNGLDIFKASAPEIVTIIGDSTTGPKIIGKAVGLTRNFERDA